MVVKHGICDHTNRSQMKNGDGRWRDERNLFTKKFEVIVPGDGQTDGMLPQPRITFLFDTNSIFILDFKFLGP
jgi:hypothetical protein